MKLTAKLTIVVAVAILIGGYFYSAAPPDRDKVIRSSRPEVSLVPTVINAARVQPDSPTAAAPAPAAPPAARLPVDAEFARLAAPGASLKDHMEAYRMAADCLRENTPVGVRLTGHVIVRGKVIAGPCELAPGTWQDIDVRRRLVTEAIDAGLGWSLMLNELPGPTSAFSESEFRELEKRALARGVEVGDPFALTSKALTLRHEAEQQSGEQLRATLKLALTYDIANAAGIAYLNGQPFRSAKDSPNLETKLPIYEAAGLKQADVAAATKEARQLVDTFKKAKEAS